MQGIWLTHTDSEVLHSRQNLEQGLQILQTWGFDTVYPVVWQRGYTLYPSPPAHLYTGQHTLATPAFTDRDFLAELIEIAHGLGLRVIAWWEYGLMLPPDCALAQRYPQYLTLTNRGSRHRRPTASAKLDPGIWLNPSHPQVVEMMGELITDLVTRYPIDGIQFDDHWSWPVELGFEPDTQAAYRQAQTGIWPFGYHPTWEAWASEQLTTAFQRIVSHIKTSRPNCLVSLAPNPLRFSIDHYRLNWQHWHQLGLIDELVIQIYRRDLPHFLAELQKPELQQIKNHTAIGILTGLQGHPQPASLIQQQIRAVQAAGFQGFSCFFYETTINLGNIFT